MNILKQFETYITDFQQQDPNGMAGTSEPAMVVSDIEKVHPKIFYNMLENEWEKFKKP